MVLHVELQEVTPDSDMSVSIPEGMTISYLEIRRLGPFAVPTSLPTRHGLFRVGAVQLELWLQLVSLPNRSLTHPP